MLDKREEAHAAVVEASIKGVGSKMEIRESDKEQDTELAEEARKEGKDVVLNDDNVIVDKRQLLGAGLNVAKPKFGSFMSLSSADPQTRQRQDEYEAYKRKKLAESAAKRTGRVGQSERERMSQEVERQMIEQQEREREEEMQKEEEFKKKLEKRTSDESTMSAKERYLARKKLKTSEKSS
jgi:coiled-coil domain-containing protein 55